MPLSTFNLKEALKKPDSLINWWWVVGESDSFKQTFNNELKQEVTFGHKLYGYDLKIIARKGSNDDCLFQFIDDERVASVHLTWRKSTEILPFPVSEIYQNLDEWFEQEYFPSLAYLLNSPNSLNQFEQIVLGYALGFIATQDFEQYIYSLDENNLPFTDMSYLDLISLDFNNKSSVLLFLNQWYKKNITKTDDFDEYSRDLINFYNSSLE